MAGQYFTIPSNAHFDTTEGNIKQMGGNVPRNLAEILFEVLRAESMRRILSAEIWT